jgi:hypothetical protein
MEAFDALLEKVIVLLYCMSADMIDLKMYVIFMGRRRDEKSGSYELIYPKGHFS